MMYPVVTLEDETEITQSGLLSDGRIKVYVEKADAEDGFHDMTCYLPEYEVTAINGFSDKEVEKYIKIIRSIPIG